MKAIKILENIKPKRQFHISRPITEEVIQEAYGAEDLEKARIASKEMLIQDMEPSLINEEEPREQKAENVKNVSSEKNDFNASNFSNDFSIETDGELGKKKIEMKGLSDWKDYDLKGVISKMVTFGTTMSGVKLYPYQIEFLQRIFESILLNDGQTITALFSRQSGKTEVVAIAIDTLMVLLPILAEIYPAQLSQYSKGIAIGLFAPTAEQGITTHSRADMRLTNEKAAQILSDPDLDAVKNYKGGILSITGPTVNIGGMIVPRYKSFCKFHSAAKQTKIESKTYNLLILEESQEIDDYKILKCYEENTIVNLSDGRRIPIKDFNLKKDKVVTPLGPAAPKEFQYTGNLPCYEITLVNGRKLTTSEYHRHYVYKKGDKPKFLTSKELFNYENTSSKAKIKYGYKLAFAEDTPFFGQEGNFDEGTILGHLLGDGCFRGGNIQFSGQKEVWDYITPILEKTFNSYVNKVKNGNTYLGFIRDKEKYNSNKLKKWIISLGLFDKKSEDKFIPDKNFSEDFLKGLIVGLFETDGSLNNKKDFSYSSVSKKLIEDIQRILLKFGVHSFIINRENNTKPIQGRKANSLPLYILSVRDVVSINKFKKTFPFYNKINNTEEYHTKNRTKSIHYPDNLRFIKIKDIRFVGNKDTYCIELHNTKEQQERNKNFNKLPTAIRSKELPTNLFMVEDGIFSSNSILPMGASTLATTILIGTPVPYRCFFYEMCQKNKLKNNVIRNHFEYDYKTVQRYNPRYAAYINIEKERQGVESDTFRLAYGLEWLLEEGMALTLQQIQEYMADFEQDFEYDRVDENAVYGAGVDFAKGTDSTVIAIFKLLPIQKVQPGEEQRFLKKFVNFIEIRGENWESQIHIILDLIQSYQLQIITVDATGKGDPLFERLQLTVDDRGLDCTVKGVVFSTKSKHDMAVHFYDEMRRRHISLPFSAAARGSKRMREFVKQWTMCEKVHDGKWMKLRHPDIKGAKDDYVDATILALYGVKDSFLRRIRVDEEAIKRKSEAEKRFEQATKSFRRIGFKRR